jgi:hypothetical protein
MTIATGVAKQVRYKAESAWGTAPGATGAQLLRRVTSDLSLRKQTYESNEIVSHYQRVDMRHGIRSVEGGIQGELSAGTWKDFLAAAVRRAFATVTAITGLSITIAGAGPTYTVTRSTGSWLTDGVKAGQMGRLTAGTFNAANLNKNLWVLSATATVLTVMPLNGVALVAEGPIAAATWTVPGKTTYAPLTGHTDTSFAIEHWHSDISVSELFLGCKVNQLDVSLPPTGMSTIGLQFMGKDVTKAGAAYYTSPAAETETGVLAAVNGLLVAEGGSLAIVTGLNFSLRGNMSAEPVIGSNTYADIAEGRILVDGQLTALFENGTMLDYFLNEDEVSLLVALSASPAAAADFMTFSLPRVKFSAADPDDGDKQLVQTLPFAALLNTTGGAGTDSEESTIAVQDSQA